MAKEIYLLNKRVRLLQPADGFKPGLDSVMLAAACPAKSGDSILDLGCGIGTAGFCVLTRVKNSSLMGVEVLADYAALARRNAKLNGFEDRAEFTAADIRKFKGERADHVICNPPYLDAGKHTTSPDAKKAKAIGHSDSDLKDWIDCAFHHLKAGGSFTMIHRADQTDKIILGLGKRFGAVEIIPLWPHAGEAAKRVILRALKDRRTPARLHPGVTLHKKDGSYTPAAQAILRKMKAI